MIPNQSVTSSFISETTLSFFTHQITLFVFGALEEKCATKTTMLRTGSAFQIIRQKCLLLQLWFLDKLLFYKKYQFYPTIPNTDLLIALEILNQIPFGRKLSEQMSLIWWKGLWSSCVNPGNADVITYFSAFAAF